MRKLGRHSYKYLIKITLVILILVMAISGCTRILKPTPISENPPIGEPQPTAGNQTITNDPMIPTGYTIAAIQGAGHLSPYQNQNVEQVHGIVTVIRAEGFYIQSLIPDNDPGTSEGIYVHQGLVPSVRPGDEVLLSGVVKEMVTHGDVFDDLPITQLRYPVIEVLSKGNLLPAPTIIGEGGRMPPTEVIDDDHLFNPQEDGLDFYESLEGMLVQVNNAVVVGPTSQYKEIVVLPDGGAWAGVRTPRGGIVVREDDFNPERVILDDALREMPFVQVGDVASKPIIGVMDYGYGNFKIQPIEDVHFVSSGLPFSKPLAPASVGQVRVASYNLGVLSAQETGRTATLAEHIIRWMASPDIIGLQEIADNDGSTGTLAISADETYQGIIDAVLRLGGPPYDYVDIDPLPDTDGGVPGGNVRVGFLYRLDRGLSLADAPHGDAESAVSVINHREMPALSLNPGRIDPGNSAFTNSRKPLVVTFLINGERLFVVNNHFNSKGPDQTLFGAVQPPVLHSEAQRLRQAQIVHDFVASILKIDPDSWVIVLGDLNDFHFSAPVGVLQGDYLHNLIETLPVPARYTYNYEGNSQVLDHILVSESLSEALVGVDILHLNSEFDYYRQFSDHDPVVATFGWE